MSEQFRPLHGGDLVGASARYGIPPAQWLDLSTGLNPAAYPVTGLPVEVFQRLPYIRPEFTAAAARYYGNDQLLPTNGSQLVIQELPRCLAAQPVLLPEYGYDEHRSHWQRHGNALQFYPAFEPQAGAQAIEAALATGRAFHLVVINPNNPTGLEFSPAQLADWAQRLQPGCCLVIDEAFADTEPSLSVLASHYRSNMIVLRSFGKFFGLAGIRLGFVFASAEVRARLQQRIGIWQVNGPAQALATAALEDRAWQATARRAIAQNAATTRQLLEPLWSRLQPGRRVQSALFSSYQVEAAVADAVQHAFARQGVLIRVVRLQGGQSLLRFGLIDGGDPTQVARLTQVVADCLRQLDKREAEHV